MMAHFWACGCRMACSVHLMVLYTGSSAFETWQLGGGGEGEGGGGRG